MRRKSIKTMTKTTEELSKSIVQLRKDYPSAIYDIEINSMDVMARDWWFIEIWRR